MESEDGFRLSQRSGGRRAAFCRLEHVVPWFMQGPHWEAGEIEEPAGLADSLDACALCRESLPDERSGGVWLLLVRHRGEHRVPDAFCSTEHLADWAKAGGRYSA